MTASEKTAVGPALPNTSITTTSCWGFSGAGKANTSDMSAVGSASARGPEKWSDMSEFLRLSVSGPGFFARWAAASCLRLLSFDGGEARRHHQAVALVDEEAGFIGELEVRLPLRIGHHGSALARAVGHILEHPQMHERIDVSALAVQIGEWRPEMAGLRCEPALGIEVKLVRHLARFDAI